MPNDLVGLLDLVLNLFTLALFGRVILSWVDPMMRSSIGRILYRVTEPILAPIRSYVPPMGMFDLSIIIAILLLRLLQALLHRALAA
jgi:YggT family protein